MGAERDPRFHEGTVFAGRFRIERLLKQGGQGAVYAARNTRTDKRLALKVMLPALVQNPTHRARFEQEVRIANGLGSPYFVEVFDADVDDATGMPWMTMELLQGHDLDDLTRNKTLLPLEIARQVLHQVGRAMGAAHSADPPLVHLDLKPANIFLHRTGFEGDAAEVVKVLDLGISRWLPKDRTAIAATGITGSVLWMAPEQALIDGELRRETDVWSMGLLAFWMLSGRYYWKQAYGQNVTLLTVLGEVISSPIEPASARARLHGSPRELPAGFDEWFARCVNRDPKRRFPHARAAVDAVLPLLPGALRTSTVPATVILDRPPPLPPRTEDLLRQFDDAERAGDDDTVIALGNALLTHVATREDLSARVASAYARRAHRHIQNGTLDAALIDVDSALSLCPDRPDLRVLRSGLYRWRGDLNAARADATFVLARYPDDVEARTALAYVRMAAGEWPLAFVDLTAALLRAPSRADLLTQRAECFRQMAMLHEAHLDAERADAIIRASNGIKPG